MIKCFYITLTVKAKNMDKAYECVITELNRLQEDNPEITKVVLRHELDKAATVLSGS